MTNWPLKPLEKIILRMCGISGIISGDREPTLQSLALMTRAQAHRGPDDEGVEVLEAGAIWCGLGHRRLAVIDPSPAGHQPMRDPETGCWITYNGEIYNFRHLRSELEAKGARFQTQTDTEVLLKAYGYWGKDCVRRLRGIFAFGIWDPRRQVLFLARDPLGVKPLYLWQGNGRFVFASEVRAILATGLVERRLDLDGLHSYLAYGSVQEPFTLVSDARSLPPGHLLEWVNGSVRLERYWRLPPPEAVERWDPKHDSGQLSHCLRDAVYSQLISDVPLGAFLSGGIDSTAIAALMRQGANGPVRTFSLVFEEAAYDERVYSRMAARHIGTEHTEVLLTGGMVRDHLEKALDSYDQPSADGLNTWFVSKAARDAGLTVALSGVGGDELFGGYNGFSKALLAERWGRRAELLPSFLQSGIAEAVACLARSEAGRKAADLLIAPRHPYFLTRRFFSNRQILTLLHPDVPVAADWQEEAFEAGRVNWSRVWALFVLRRWLAQNKIAE